MNAAARSSALLTATLLLACVGGARPGGASGMEVNLDEEFTLAPGQTARADGGALTVRFLGVPHDSRCPADVTCITAGNAVARLRLTAAGGGQETVELNTTVGPKDAAHGGYTVHLVALRPEPTAGSRTPPASYRAVLRIAKA